MKRMLMIWVLLFTMGCAAQFEAMRESSRPITKMGMDKLAKEDIQGAYVKFKNAEEFNPTDPEVHYGLALTYRQWHKYDQALASTDKAIKYGDKIGFEHPGMKSEAYNLKGDILFTLKRYDQALEAFSLALADDLYANPEYSLYNRGNVYMTLGKPGEARNDFEAALAKNPRYAPAWLGIAQTATKKGDVDEAIKALQNALKEFPDFAEAHASLAQIYLKQGNKKEAAGHLKEVMRIDKGGVLAKEAEQALDTIE